MLKLIFEGVLMLSLVGSLAALSLLAIRPLTRKAFSPRWHYYSWLLVLNALILPLQKPVPTVLYLPKDTHSMLYSDAQTPIRQASEIVGMPTTPSVDWFAVCAAFWAAGIIFFLCLKITRYLLFCGELRKNSLADEREYGLPAKLAVRRTWLLDAPLVIGLLKPTMYLPETVDDADLHYVLAHETTHYKRRDLLYKWYTLAVVSVHWFNPLMRVISRQIDAECEASCDFEVTRRLNDAEKADYMNMILGRFSVARHHRPLTTRMASSKAVLKRRFLTIRNGKESGRRIRLFSIAAALVLMLLTNLFGTAFANRVWDETVIIYTDSPELPVKKYEEQPKEPAVVEEETPIVSEEPAVTESEPVLPEGPIYPGEVTDLIYSTEMTADRILGMAKKPLADTDILLLAEMSKEVTYNSDIQGKQTLTVYPDANGKITVFFDSSEPRMIAGIEIRNANHPGGWGYRLPTDSKIAYEFGGFDPNTAYIVTINTYCPGNYGIEGRALIY